MKRLGTLRCLAAAVIAVICFSQADARTHFTDRRQAASNYYAYPYPERPLPAITPAPAGYHPFHIEHYGRHGSRWIMDPATYATPVSELEKAEAAGKLTPKGMEVLSQLRAINDASQKRVGELTPVGADQHRGIARRMTSNFPEVFADSGRIDARSTIVIRCILSMDNELQEIKAYNPDLNITSDASYATMYYMNNTDTDSAANAEINAAQTLLADFREAHPMSNAVVAELVTDTVWAKRNMDIPAFKSALFEVAANTQSHYDQPDLLALFTDEDLEQRWLGDNANWYLRAGNSPITHYQTPKAQRYLLANIIASADTALAQPGHGANMRFGHESVLIPLAVYMDFNDYSRSFGNLELVADQWRNYEIFPMACNLQMVFYRPDGSVNPDDVIVKVLLNEEEVVLPIDQVAPSFYAWKDLRSYYADKLALSGIDVDKPAE